MVRHPGTFTVMTQKDVEGDTLYASPPWCRIARGTVPQWPDETIIALRVGCTEGDLGEWGNHARGKWPHAVREARFALVMVLYCTWTIVSSRNQRYLHIDARTNPQSIHM